MSKQEQYTKISQDVIRLIGGKDNIQGAAHCATRLRIVLKDKTLIQSEELEKVELVKGSFIAGEQLQIIFGAGTVNEVYAVFAKEADISDMSLSDVKELGTTKLNPFQSVIKALSDVFVEIIPAILASALLLGLVGFFGKQDFVTSNEYLKGFFKIADLASVGAFAYLPLLVCYSATKRFGGRAVLGIVVGGIMLLPSLANAYDIGSANFKPEYINFFGLNVALIGFQGGVLIALMMGWIVASLDKFFSKIIPDVVKLIFVPVITVFISTILLFTIVGPVGRELSNIITMGLVNITKTTGIFGYMLFAGIQQIIVITGLHHILGAVEAQLIATTGFNFLNPLMSVALMAQGGAVLGYLFLNWKDAKAKEISIPSFASILFGISEPAIFGINLKHKFPLIAGCIAAAISGGYVYITNLTSTGFGATAIPGFFIASSANNGYLNFVIAHLIATVLGALFTIVLAKFYTKKTEEVAVTTVNDTIVLKTVANGEVKSVSESDDETFASKMMGDGYLVVPTNGTIVAPCDATIEFVFPTKHALGLILKDGSKLLIHAGIDTVKLNGNGFESFVKDGQKVKAGDKLITMDLDLVQNAGYSTQIMVIVVELANGRNAVITPNQTNVATIS